MSFGTGRQEKSLKYGVSRKIQYFYRREFGLNNTNRLVLCKIFMKDGGHPFKTFTPQALSMLSK